MKQSRDRQEPEREDFYDDWYPEEKMKAPAPREMTEAEREKYYADRDAYYARRDAYYARRDAYYAEREAEGDYYEDEEEYEEDYEDEYDEEDDASRKVGGRRVRAQKKARPAARKRRRRRKFSLRRLLCLLLLAGIVALLLGTQPVRNASGADRVPGRSCILLAGTDASGWRTDTIMLLSLDKSAGAVRLVSIPRDTYAPDYAVPKINSAYGAAGGGEEGMEALLRQVEKVTGFLPDGYVLMDIDCFVRAVDLLGGLDFDVPVDMRYDDPVQDLHIDLRAGMQHLDGRQVMELVRFRSGYANADIGRTEVQRAVLKAAMKQWLRPSALKAVPELYTLFRENTVTDLTGRNLLWIARALVKADRDSMATDVLPGWPDMVGDASVYMIDRQAADALLRGCDPYRE